MYVINTWLIKKLIMMKYKLVQVSKKKAWEKTYHLKIYLPEDEWIHLWTGKEYQGGTVTVAAELGYTPAFYRKDSKYAELFSEIREKYGVK